jgi:hypothetical protein
VPHLINHWQGELSAGDVAVEQRLQTHAASSNKLRWSGALWKLQHQLQAARLRACLKHQFLKRQGWSMLDRAQRLGRQSVAARRPTSSHSTVDASAPLVLATALHSLQASI